MLIWLISLLLLAIIAMTFLIFGEKEKKEKTTQQKTMNNCCGAHEICEKENLLSGTTEILYYDDEELDLFINKKNIYTVQEIKVFEEVLYTLKEEDVEGWLQSLQLRNIKLPEVLKDEVLLIISEKRGIEMSH